MKNLLERTQEGYSFERYSTKGWEDCVKLLQNKGFCDEAVVAFMLSKHMRWAADMYGASYGNVDANALRKYLERYPKYSTKEYSLKELI